MGTYRHILLAVAYSGNEDLLIRRAKDLAEKYQARLSMIHVLDNIPMPDTGYGTVIPLDTDSGYGLLEAEKTKLMGICDRFDVVYGNCWMIWGAPNQEIVQFAEREQVDLIVVGSHGWQGLSVLFSSTANSLLHDAGCDVMAVRLLND